MLLPGRRQVPHSGQQQQQNSPVICAAGRQAAVLTAPGAPPSTQKARRLRKSTLSGGHDEQTQEQRKQQMQQHPSPKQMLQQEPQQRRRLHVIKGVPQNLDSLLTSMIMSCTCWQDLQQLVTLHQHSFKPIHVATALNKLAKVVTHSTHQHRMHPGNQQLYWQLEPYHQQQQQQQQRVDPMQMLEIHHFVNTELVPLLTTHVTGLGARGLANSIWALSKLGLVPAGPDLLLLYQQLAAVVADLEPQHISSVLYAFAQWQQQQQQQQGINLSAVVPSSNNSAAGLMQIGLKFQQQRQPQLNPTAEVAQQQQQQLVPIPYPLLHSLMATAASKLPDFGPQALSNTLYAAALLQYHPSPAWLDQFWRASILQLPAVEQQHLSNMLYAAAVLRVDPPEPWHTAWLHHSSRSLDRATVQGLSNSIWAVAKLKWAAAALEIVNPAGSSNSSSLSSNDSNSSSWLGTFCSTTVGQLSVFSDQALSNCCWAIGCIAQQLNKQQQQQLASRRESSPSPAITLSTLQQLLLDSGWQQQLLMRLNPRTLLGFNPQQLSNTIWSLASIGSDLPKPWLDSYIRASGPRLIQFKPQELSNILVACARISHKPGTSWMTLFELSVQRHMTTCSSQVISNVVWAMVRLQHEPSERWLQSLLLEARNRTAAELADSEPPPAAAAAAIVTTEEGGWSACNGSSSSNGSNRNSGYQFTPQGLSILLLALSQLAAVDRPGSSSSSLSPSISSLCAAVCQRLLSNSSSGSSSGSAAFGLSGFTSQGLAALAGAAALCDQQDLGQQLLLEIMQELLQRQQQRQQRQQQRQQARPQLSRDAQAQQQGLVKQEEAAEPSSSSSSGGSSGLMLADVCMTLWAAARLDCQPPIELMMPLSHSVLQFVQLLSHRYRLHRSLHSSSSCSSTKAAAGAGAAATETPVSRSTIHPDSRSSHAAAILASAGPGCKYLGALMYALGYLGCDPGSAWTRAWFNVTETLLSECSSWTLAMLLWGAVWLEIVPPSRWLRAWATAWRAQQQQQQQQQRVLEAAEGDTLQQEQQCCAVAAQVAAAAGRKGLEVTQQAVAGCSGLQQLRRVEDLRRLCLHLVKEGWTYS